MWILSIVGPRGRAPINSTRGTLPNSYFWEILTTIQGLDLLQVGVEVGVIPARAPASRHRREQGVRPAHVAT